MVFQVAKALGIAAVCWRPGAEGLADLPLVAERVDYPGETPAVLVADRRRFLGASADGLLCDRVGVVAASRPAG